MANRSLVGRLRDAVTFARVSVGAGLSVCHFLPECFPDASAFDPARYAEPRNEHLRSGAFAPFGLGAHPCLGAGLVEVLVMATVAALLHTVSLELDRPDYVMRRVVNPFPEPESRFAVRIIAQRQAVAPRRRARDEADVATAVPSPSRETLARVVRSCARSPSPPGRSSCARVTGPTASTSWPRDAWRSSASVATVSRWCSPTSSGATTSARSISSCRHRVSSASVKKLSLRPALNRRRSTCRMVLVPFCTSCISTSSTRQTLPVTFTGFRRSSTFSSLPCLS